jgi:hypothetical protein
VRVTRRYGKRTWGGGRGRRGSVEERKWLVMSVGV